MKLRYYQEEAVDSVYQYLSAQSGDPIVALPTGTGKSIVIAAWCRLVLEHYPGQRILVATHVKELIEQNHQKLLMHWATAPAGIYSASVGRREVAPITFVGIQTVAKRFAEFGKVDLLLIDECHLVGDGQNTQYLQFIHGLKLINPRLRVIGLTATPYRLGMGMITDGGIFTSVCYDMTERQSFNRLVAQGYIAPLICRKTTTELDVSAVHKQAGEYMQKELQDAVDKAPITAAALKETIELAGDRKHWLIFAAGISHANNIAQMLHLMRITSIVVSGDMPKKEREQALHKFKSGEYRAVVNYNVLTTGFDFPGIDLIVMLRPTSSPGLWVQMLGRGTRPIEGKANCLVLDFAGNTRRLGPINDPVIPRKKGKGGNGIAPVRICPNCATYNHASVRVCEACGQEFPTVIKIEASASLQQVVADDLPQIVNFQVDSVLYREHVKLGKPTSLRVTYVCGLRRFDEWVCLEHTSYAGHRAKLWWEERAKKPSPETVADALVRVNEIAQPSNIRVWINTKYPEIMGYEL
jgi:DNA repair protein RadD